MRRSVDAIARAICVVSALLFVGLLASAPARATGPQAAGRDAHSSKDVAPNVALFEPGQYEPSDPDITADDAGHSNVAETLAPPRRSPCTHTDREHRPRSVDRRLARARGPPAAA